VERLARDKHSSFLCPFTMDKKIVNFSFGTAFITLNSKVERLARDKHSSFLCLLAIYEK
jgi:hypothetical protein